MDSKRWHLITRSISKRWPGDIVSDKEYENFELSIDWNIADEGNSGIMFMVKEDKAYENTYITGPEYQLLDDKKAEDNKQANHLAGSLYDIIAPAKAASKTLPVSGTIP